MEERLEKLLVEFEEQKTRPIKEDLAPINSIVVPPNQFHSPYQYPYMPPPYYYPPQHPPYYPPEMKSRSHRKPKRYNEDSE